MTVIVNLTGPDQRVTSYARRLLEAGRLVAVVRGASCTVFACGTGAKKLMELAGWLGRIMDRLHVSPPRIDYGGFMKWPRSRITLNCREEMRTLTIDFRWAVKRDLRVDMVIYGMLKNKVDLIIEEMLQGGEGGN